VPESSRGIALIAVLWILAALTLCASVLVTRSVSDRRSLERLIASESAKIVADGAIRLALLSATGGASMEEASRMASSGQPIGRHLSVHLQMESGRIDLNAAPPALLASVFEEAGWPAERAHAIADRLALYRSSTRASAGAARTEQGPNMSGHGLLENVAELKQLAADASISDDLLDVFTVYTRAPEPNLTFASDLVRRAAERLRAETGMAPMPANGASTATAAQAQVIGEVIRIKACLDDQAVHLCRVAIARATGGSSQLAQMFSWYTQR
jgi:type II secretory pathway component PulK